MKTELLVQMDGCSPTAQQCQLLLVGATNRPEVPSHALLDVFDRRPFASPHTSQPHALAGSTISKD